MIREIIDEAIRAYGHETAKLRFLPENRYNKRFFPQQGQYDWFSGQALYCLVRHVKPSQVIEISCCNGYSSIFTGSALRANGSGRLETFELFPENARIAQANFSRWGVQDYIRVHVGDARQTTRHVNLDKTDILFIDSVHTESFARWYMDEVVSQVPAETLMHVHDIMPRDARVRFFDGPPFRNNWTVSWAHRTYLRLFRPEWFSLVQIPESAIRRDGSTCTYDGNYFSEAVFVNELVDRIDADDYAYMHQLADQYPQLQPREFDRVAIGRKSSAGAPMEWNESLWCRVGALRAAYAETALPIPPARGAAALSLR